MSDVNIGGRDYHTRKYGVDLRNHALDIEKKPYEPNAVLHYVLARNADNLGLRVDEGPTFGDTLGALKSEIGESKDFEIWREGYVALRHTDWRPDISGRGFTELIFQRLINIPQEFILIPRGGSQELIRLSLEAVLNQSQFRIILH